MTPANKPSTKLGVHPAIAYRAFDARVIWGAAIGGIIGGSLTQVIGYILKSLR